MQKSGHHVTSFGTVRLWRSSRSGYTGQKLAERFLKLVLISFPRHTSSLSPTEKNGRSVTKQKKDAEDGVHLASFGVRGTDWPELLSPSLPHLLHRQQLQGSLVLQSILSHGTSVWLHCSQTAVTFAKSHGSQPREVGWRDHDP